MFVLQKYYLGIKLSFRSLGVLKTILTSHTLHKNQLSFQLARPKVKVENVEIKRTIEKKKGERLGGRWREVVKCGLWWPAILSFSLLLSTLDAFQVHSNCKVAVIKFWQLRQVCSIPVRAEVGANLTMQSLHRFTGCGMLGMSQILKTNAFQNEN